MPQIFASRDTLYKTPYGAVRSGGTIRFSIRPSRGFGCCGASLCLKADSDGASAEIPMTWEALSSSADVYSCALASGLAKGLYWYYFKLLMPRGGFLALGRAFGGRGVISENPEPWQLTVYEEGPCRNAWYGEGITYHIFPDRFRRLSVPSKTGWRSERIIHDRWEDTPFFEPDENNEIKNNDFFGGTINGIISRLPYLASLHVSSLYLSPIFESSSNHRYDTGDYLAVDPMLGTIEDFRLLCAEAGKYSIRIILDGVFNHTGFDSRYFNGRGNYDGAGACQSKASPYYPWYDFSDWPSKYSCWWGIYTLPQTRECEKSFRDFIFGADGSVVKTWLAAGASGFRLDVADELPDEFIFGLKKELVRTKPDAILLGEVWEDASSKISYDCRRRYILGGGLDGVMNYPFRNALISYLKNGDASAFCESMETLRENYPPGVFHSLMNHIGTHDTPRILTVLGAAADDFDRLSKPEKAAFRLSPEKYAEAVRLLKIGAAIQFCFPGSPAVYYGDEAGMQGFEDPLNRGGYPWGDENGDLLSWYQTISALRAATPALQKGDLKFLPCGGDILVFARALGGQEIFVASNRGAAESAAELPEGNYADLVRSEIFHVQKKEDVIPLLPVTVRILRRQPF